MLNHPLKLGKSHSIASIKGANKELVDNIMEGNKNLLIGFKQSEEEISKLQADLIKSAGESSKTLIKESGEVLSKLENNIDTTVKKALEDTATLIKGQMTDISEATSQHCTNKLQLFADKLATVTNKFTSDYTDLLHEMDQVIRSWRNRG